MRDSVPRVDPLGHLVIRHVGDILGSREPLGLDVRHVPEDQLALLVLGRRAADLFVLGVPFHQEEPEAVEGLEVAHLGAVEDRQLEQLSVHKELRVLWLSVDHLGDSSTRSFSRWLQRGHIRQCSTCLLNTHTGAWSYRQTDTDSGGC